MPLSENLCEVSYCLPTSSKKAPIHGCDALPKLLENSERAARQVRMVVLACASFNRNLSAEIHVFLMPKNSLIRMTSACFFCQCLS